MPFTLSHPAIVLPFGMKKNKYVDFTALVIGSMAPDFEYFLHFRPYRTIGHSFLGQLYFNLPLILILALVFHYIIKEPMITNLPKPFCNNYYYIARDKWKLNSVLRIIVFIYSALIGAFSHIFWDGFTHSTGFFVEKFHVLREYIDIAGIRLPVYNLLQHLSSIMGLIAIFLFIIYKRDKNSHMGVKNATANKIIYWSGVILITIFVMIIKRMLTGKYLIASLIITSINGFFIGLIIMSILIKVKSKISLIKLE